jgi:hypothetical protein
MATLQSMRVLGPKLVAPEANRLVGNGDPPLGQEIFDVPMAQIEAKVEPDGVLDDLRRKSMALVLASRVFHPGMVARLCLTWQYLNSAEPHSAGGAESGRRGFSAPLW